MSTAKRVPKLTEKAKAAVEERQTLLNKLPNSSTDSANEKETPSEAAFTRPLTKRKNANGGDALVAKKAHNMANEVNEDVPTDEEPACNLSPAVEPEESPEDELGTLDLQQSHITFNLFCRTHVQRMVLTGLSVF